jgi:hypothetical protein
MPSALEGSPFHNELIEDLLRLSGSEQSFTTAHSKERNAIVERDLVV